MCFVAGVFYAKDGLFVCLLSEVGGGVAQVMVAQQVEGVTLQP